MSSAAPTPAATTGRLGRDVWHLIGVVAPGIAWLVIFLVLPSLMLIGIAFMTNSVYGLPTMPLSIESFKSLAGFGILGWSDNNIEILLRSIWQSVISTGLVVLISYPVAYYITTCSERIRPLMLLLVVVPSWSNVVIRTIGWMDLLAPGTFLSDIAVQLGFIPQHMGLFPSDFAVMIGLVYNFLPFMVLPLYAVFERLDYTLVEAARDLQAGPVRAFFHAVFPQTLPGLVAGTVLVAIPAFGQFVIPELLGGGKSMMIGNLVAQQFSAAANWPYGAAGSLIMILATLLGLQILRRVSKRAGGGVEVVI